MNTRKKCELCNCEVEIPLMVEYFDFCMNCLFSEGRCKECKNSQTLDELVKLRLKTELIIMNAEVNLSEIMEMREKLNIKKKENSKIN